MVDWYRPLTRLLERAPRETRSSPGALRTWLEGRQRVGELPADDLNMYLREQGFNERALAGRDVGELPDPLRNPEVYENYLTDDFGLAGTAERSPWRLRDPTEAHDPEGVPRVAGFGEPRYNQEDMTHTFRPHGDSYREVVVRSPELGGVPDMHFGRVARGGRRNGLSTAVSGDLPPVGRGRANDVLGWLRLQEYNPHWANADHDPRANEPWLWLDELQSERMNALRQQQRSLTEAREVPLEWRDAGTNWAPDPGTLAERQQMVDAAGRNLAPWTNTWDSTLFRRALQEAAAGDAPRLAWTSGQEQALRWPTVSPGAFSGLYDRRLPDVARRETRRLGLEPASVGTGEARYPGWQFTPAAEEAQPRSFMNRDVMDAWADSQRVAGSGERATLTVPYHYVDVNDDTRRAVERYGLPYFREGGSVG